MQRKAVKQRILQKLFNYTLIQILIENTTVHSNKQNSNPLLFLNSNPMYNLSTGFLTFFFFTEHLS